MHNLTKIITELDKAIEQAEQPHYGDIDSKIDHYFEAMETIRALREALKDQSNV